MNIKQLYLISINNKRTGGIRFFSMLVIAAIALITAYTFYQGMLNSIFQSIITWYNSEVVETFK